MYSLSWTLLIITSTVQTNQQHNEGENWGGILNAGQQINSRRSEDDNMNPEDQDEGDLLPKRPRFDMLDNGTWVPPEFKEALDNFDEARNEIKNIMRQDKPEGKNMNLLGTVYAIGGLAKHVAENGWQPYVNNYANLIISFHNKAARNPKRAKMMIRCFLQDANKKMDEMTSLIYNEWIQYICKMQPPSCDAVIFSQVKICSGPQIERQADLLLNLGDMAATYLNSRETFNKPPEEITVQIALNEGSKKMFRSLVATTLNVFKLLYPNGIPPTNIVC